MTKDASISLGQLDAVSASDTPFEFEVQTPSGAGMGIFLSILGSQSERVVKETNRLVNERRRADAIRQAVAGSRRPGDAVTPVEDDIGFGQRLSSVRIVGWRGIKEEFSPELALKLCQSNADISGQVLDKSNDMGNFIKA